jgi:5-methylcytosine-specific restriction endonuclease McrA
LRRSCACRASPHEYDPRRATLDHIVPLEQGGSDHITNLRLAHRSCNIKRGNEEPKRALT